MKIDVALDDGGGATAAEQVERAFVARLARASGYRDRSLTLTAEGQRFWLPVLERRVGKVVPLHLSLPFGLHGSLWPEPESAFTYAALMRAGRAKLGSGLVFQNFSHGRAARAGFFELEALETHVLVTRGVKYDDLFRKTFDSKLRNQIRKGEKSQLRIENGNHSTLLDHFYALYLLSNERWGTRAPKYSRSFFEAFAGAPFFEVKVAYHEDQPISAIVLLKLSGQWLYWFGALDKSKSNLCPNHLLISRALQQAVEEGAELFNFGLSGPLDSVRKFKESFGAETRAYATYFLGPAPLGAALRHWLNRGR